MDTKQLQELRELANKAISGSWPFFTAALYREMTPHIALELISMAERARSAEDEVRRLTPPRYVPDLIPGMAASTQISLAQIDLVMRQKEERKRAEQLWQESDDRRKKPK